MDSDNILEVCTNSQGDRKIYALLRNSKGQVWNRKHDMFEDFREKKYSDYCIQTTYLGGDIYNLIMPPNSKVTVICVLFYIQGNKEPDIYDELYDIYGAEMPKNIPEKMRPIAPYTAEVYKSRPRSKVKKDYYSE